MQFDQGMCKNFGKQNSILGSVVPLAIFYSSFRGAAGDTDLNFRKVSTSGSGLLPTSRFISSAANAVAPEKTDKHFKAVEKGWLAIAKLKPLSLFISLLLMLKKALDNGIMVK